jgi:hypothetical protein
VTAKPLAASSVTYPSEVAEVPVAMVVAVEVV